MLIRPVDPVSVTELQLQIDSRFGQRSEGLHLSEIIADIMWRREGDKYLRDENPSPSARALWEAGFWWELAAGKAYADRLRLAYPTLLTQIELDHPTGISSPKKARKVFGTTDLINTQHDAIQECKFTKISSVHPFDGPRFWKYHAQGKGYCKMANMRKVRYDVMFANGGYEKVAFGDVEMRAWEVEYSRREIEDNWTSHMNHVRVMIKEGKIR